MKTAVFLCLLWLIQGFSAPTAEIKNLHTSSLNSRDSISPDSLDPETRAYENCLASCHCSRDSNSILIVMGGGYSGSMSYEYAIKTHDSTCRSSYGDVIKTNCRKLNIPFEKYKKLAQDIIDTHSEYEADDTYFATIYIYTPYLSSQGSVSGFTGKCSRLIKQFEKDSL
jgi:hypothetical protein